MKEQVITRGDNFSPPVVCSETSKEIYDLVRGEDFDVPKFNALLMAVVTYLDKHDVDYGDKALPWAEICTET